MFTTNFLWELSLLPRGAPGRHGADAHHRSLWEQSLLAMAVGQSAVILDVLTLSRASFAPTGAFPGGAWGPMLTTNLLWELSLLPQGTPGRHGADAHHRSLWELSLLPRGAPGRHGADAHHRSLWELSLLPRGAPGRHGADAHHRSLWEQSLLAMAVGQSAVILDVLTLSRASFAPTGVP